MKNVFKGIYFFKKDKKYSVRLKDSGLYFYVNDELVNMKEVDASYNSNDLLKSVTTIASKFGITPDNFKFFEK